MLRWLLILQLPLLYLPLCVYGLGVFGSDFDVLAGRLFIALIVLLLLLDRFAAHLLVRSMGPLGMRALLVVATLVSAAAYRPLHIGYWDEHSTSQALAVCLLGLLSWAIARLAAAPCKGVGEPPAWNVACSLLVLGAVWSTAWWYPMLPMLGLGAVFALASARVTGEAREHDPRAQPAVRFGAFEAVATLCIAVDAFLIVWDYQWVTTWAGHIALFFASAGIFLAVGPRTGSLWLIVGALNFGLASLLGSWVLNPLHTALAGVALGGLLSGLLGISDWTGHGSEHKRRSKTVLGGFTFFWVLGLALGLGLYQNLAHAAWRLLLLLLAAGLAWRAHEAHKTA